MIAVSDGFYKENWSTEALIIEVSEYTTHQISSTCTCLGHPKDQDSYRSELAGLFQVVSFVEEIIQKFNILEGAITIKCNGLNAIKKSMDRETRYSCISNHFDLISAIDQKS